MSERIINITCPNCKHGIKHDTLMGTTTGVAPEEYPKVTEEGKAWCKRCQHGTYPNEDGLCSECVDKGRMTRTQPKIDTNKVAIEKVKELNIETKILEEDFDIQNKPIEKPVEKPKVKTVNKKSKGSA